MHNESKLRAKCYHYIFQATAIPSGITRSAEGVVHDSPDVSRWLCLQHALVLQLIYIWQEFMLIRHRCVRTTTILDGRRQTVPKRLLPNDPPFVECV